MPEKVQPEPSNSAPGELPKVLLETWAVNDAMNQHLLKELDPKAWRVEVKGAGGDAPRTIAAIFVHMHNCRVHWLKYNAPHLESPALLDPRRCTRTQAASALGKSAKQCLRMLEDALSGAPDRKVKKFACGWGRAWPAGGTMFAYMFSHEAHHRGQILLIAHQLGLRLSRESAGGIWNWDRLWKEQGLSKRPR
ncbi:MAG TPA: DinB family protein [Terracidiphilus sp.]|nr:DinB family protein [Terracidiphilus sp.]